MPQFVRRKRRKAADNKQLRPFTPGPVLRPILSEKNTTPEVFRHGDYLHVSDLLKECVRKVALADLLKKRILKDPLHLNIELVFEQGHAVENFLVNQLTRRSPSKIWSRWTCRCRLIEVRGTYEEARDHAHCIKCGSPAKYHNEVSYQDDEYLLSGSVDIHYVEDGAFIPLESKSDNANKWMERHKAEPDHVLQVLNYWRMMRNKGLPMHDKAVVAYTGKDVYRTYPVKEYPQHASKSMKRLEPLLEEAAQWAEFKKRGTLPTRTCCDTPNHPKARKCPFVVECFETYGDE